MKTKHFMGLIAGALVLSASGAAATFHGPPAADPEPAAAVETTATLGLFTPEQAERGRAGYEANCIGCHGANLEGGPAPTLVGPDFGANWMGSTVAEFFAWLSENMPAGAPGTLAINEYADIAAFLFQANGFAAGTEEFDPADEGWANVVIEAPPR